MSRKRQPRCGEVHFGKGAARGSKLDGLYPRSRRSSVKAKKAANRLERRTYTVESDGGTDAE